MSRLSDDEKRVFTDRIEALERQLRIDEDNAAHEIHQLRTENASLTEKMDTYLSGWGMGPAPLLSKIAQLEAENDALKRENERLLRGIRSARHCLTYGKPPIEGGRFDIGTTYAKLSKLLGEPWDALLKESE